jgi:aminoglycoside phosphotransferase (APT) family kinase protein
MVPRVRRALAGRMLSEETLPAYLRARGAVPADVDLTVRALSGGVSNVVLRANWDGGAIVVKQSLPKLRVAADWPFDRSRILVERNCLDALGRLLPGSAPAVVFADPGEYVLGMTALPAGGVVWKDAMLAGEVEPQRTVAAARLLGALHRRSAADPALASRFADQMPLIQGRIDPYHRTVARAHPDLADRIGAEIERMLATRRTLVHGDFSPKNLIAYPDRMCVLDCEVAHWGDPAFDAAFMLCHLVLKAIHVDARFAGEAERFWVDYVAEAGPAAALGEDTVVELGCLLMARVDGMSPAEYLTDEGERTAVRALGRSILSGEAEASLPAVLAASVS